MCVSVSVCVFESFYMSFCVPIYFSHSDILTVHFTSLQSTPVHERDKVKIDLFGLWQTEIYKPPPIVDV